jgi:hypothetical protein
VESIPQNNPAYEEAVNVLSWFSPRHSGDDGPQTTLRVIHPGEPPEQVNVVHNDGSVSEVTVSADNDEFDVEIEPSVTHSPHLHGHYA